MANNSAAATRKEQAENTRQKLLGSARELFYRNGYKGTSVRSINRRINLADGLLYHYFPGGKKEIFQIIVTEDFRKISNELKATQSDIIKLPLEKFLELAYTAFTEIVNANIGIIRIIVKEKEVREFISKENILSVIDCHSSLFSDYLREKAKEGEVREMDFESAALTMKSILVNYILLKVLDIDTVKPGETEYMKRIISYQVSLWKNTQPKD